MTFLALLALVVGCGSTDKDGATESTADSPTDTAAGSDTGSPSCGNGIIDDGEQCDGGNTGGFGCTDLGYSGGTLGCDPMSCTYDTSTCTL